MHFGRRVLLVLLAVLATAAITSCAGVRGPATVGTIGVRSTGTTASDTLTVSVVDTAGHTVRQATGPGVGWSARFTDVPAGRYRVRLLIAGPVVSGPGGTVATSQSVLVQAPLTVQVGPGTTTQLTYDGQDWTAVQ